MQKTIVISLTFNNLEFVKKKNREIEKRNFCDEGHFIDR